MDGWGKELGGTVASLGLGIGLLWYARSLPPSVLAGQPEFIGPSYFPTLVGILLVFLSLVQLIQLARYKKKEESSEKGHSSPTVLGIAGLGIYISLIPLIGFYIATLSFLIIFFLVTSKGGFRGNNKSVVWYVLLPIALTVGIYFIFERLLWVLPPRGILF